MLRWTSEGKDGPWNQLERLNNSSAINCAKALGKPVPEENGWSLDAEIMLAESNNT
jgi:hypothetical protein